MHWLRSEGRSEGYSLEGAEMPRAPEVSTSSSQYESVGVERGLEGTRGEHWPSTGLAIETEDHTGACIS